MNVTVVVVFGIAVVVVTVVLFGILEFGVIDK
jgi:hypothetical protein